MARDTVTLTLEGDIPIDLYAKAIGHFSALITALSEEVSGSNPIEWDVVQLSSGSATATLRGIGPDLVSIERAVIGYGIVGRSLQDGTPIPYSEDVVDPALALTSVLNGHVRGVRLITDDSDSYVKEPVRPETQKQGRRTSLGVITGYVDAIWSAPRPKIGLYDNLFDRRVMCYLDADKYELARDVWRKNVAVMGMVYRDPETGRPIDVTDVVSVELVGEKQPGAFLRAGGLIPWQEGDEPSEVIVRRMRDAE